MVRSSKKRKYHSVNDEVTVSLIFGQTESDSLLQSMRSLYEARQLCDITFKVGHLSFHAHRVILAAANSYLGAMV